ncbi:MAG: glycosyltransferase [Candidatus Muiribacteriota bacterium]
MNKFSIIIPTFNREKTLYRCLKHLEKQNFFLFEIIIINDYRKKFSIDFKQFKKLDIKIFEPCLEKGPGYCRNIGLKHAKTEYSVFIDDDCFAEKNWAETIHTTIIQKNIPVCKGKVLFSNKTVTGRYLSASPWGYNTSAEFSSTCNLIVKTSLAIKTGFNPEFDFAFEDVDFCKRLNPFNIKYSSKIKVLHFGKDNLKNLLKSYFNYGKGKYKYLKISNSFYLSAENKNLLKKIITLFKFFIQYINKKSNNCLPFGLELTIFILLEITKTLSYKLGFYYEKWKD